LAKSSTTLKKGDNLPSRGKAKKTLMLEAIRSVCGSEDEFLRRVVAIALGGDDNGPNVQLLTLALQRIEPPLKATMPLVEFDFDSSKPIHDQATQIVVAMSNGIIPSDVGSTIVNSLTSMMKIQELTDFEERLKAIEDASDES
jgi:hypothetical protein